MKEFYTSKLSYFCVGMKQNIPEVVFKKNPKQPQPNKLTQQNQKTQTTQTKNEVVFFYINLFKIFVWIINGFKAPQYIFVFHVL